MSNISIGKDKWIKWVDFNRYVYDQCIPINYDQCFEIDYLLEPTFDFWNKLETECVAGCCGINAYNLWEKDIHKAIEVIDKAELIKNFNYAKTEIKNRKEAVVISNKLNQLFDKTVFIQLINHILLTISNDK